MQSHKHNRLEIFYNAFGYNKTIRFVFHSKLVQFLVASRDLSKIIELVSLGTKERSIIKYLNYLEDKKRTIMPLYSSVITQHNSTNGVKMSPRQLRYMKVIINNLTQNKLIFFKSFVGVLELDQDNLRLERVRVKAQKITSLYTAIIPLCNIDFKEVVLSLNSRGIKSSEQDIIAFLSLINELSYDGINVNIPASVWESIFGRYLIKDAKQVFQELGVLQLVRKPIRGFKSAGYKFNLTGTLYKVEEKRSINMIITSIRTLEKLNRIKKHKGNFTLNEKPKALKLIIDLKLKDMRMSGRFNLTNIFLESGKIQVLINDLERMLDIINDEGSYAIAVRLGKHITAYSDSVKKGNFKTYRPLYEKGFSRNL